MNWDDLRIFLAIARSGQLLAAARRLGLNHTTVARRLTALEQAFSVRLVNRRTTGCELTPAGEELLARTERMEAEMMQAQASIANKDIAVSGTVRIAAPDGFGVAFLAPRLSDLSKRYPELQLQLVPISRSFSLPRREADIAITVERPLEGRLIARKLVDYTLALYAREDYLQHYGTPATVADLARHRLIGYVDDLVASASLAYASEVNRDWQSNFQISSALGQLEAVRSGAGIGILHSYIARPIMGLTRILPEIAIQRTYWLSYHEAARGLRRISEVSEFIAYLVEKERSRFR